KIKGIAGRSVQAPDQSFYFIYSACRKKTLHTSGPIDENPLVQFGASLCVYWKLAGQAQCGTEPQILQTMSEVRQEVSPKISRFQRQKRGQRYLILEIKVLVLSQSRLSFQPICFPVPTQRSVTLHS